MEFACLRDQAVGERCPTGANFWFAPAGHHVSLCAVNAISRRFFLPLFSIILAWALQARGQRFFDDDGIDVAHYVPNVPGTPNGRIYVGDGNFFEHPECHYRINILEGKTVKNLHLGTRYVEDGDNIPVVWFVNSAGKMVEISRDEMKYVNRHGMPCLPKSAALAVARAGPAVTGREIAVSNAADAFAITCDGRFAVVVGHGGGASPVPVSLVDVVAGREVDTLDFPGLARSVAACDDRESVLVLVNDPGDVRNSVRRLRIVNGKLTDTGERLDVPGNAPDRYFLKTYAVPGSKVGVALGVFGAPEITTFSIPGLQVLDSAPALFGSAEKSLAVSCAGDRIFLRGNLFVGADGRGRIHGFTLDPVTGAIGDTPFLTTDVAYTVQASTTFGDGLAISRDGTQLIVPETTSGSTAPTTSRTSFLDTTTGARVGFFDAFGAGAQDYPTLVATHPCCAGTGLRLGIQRLAAGLIQITATGEVGKKYELQKSQNLVAWEKLLEFQMTASPAPYTDPDSQTNSTRFYRLQLIP